jgi:hypothetical protein
LDDLQSAPPAVPAEETVPAEDSTQVPPQKRVLLSSAKTQSQEFGLSPDTKAMA